MQRTEVLEKLETLSASQIRHVDDPTQIKINVTPDMITMRPRRGAQLLEVSKEGAKSMVNFIGLPLHIARALSPGTFTQCLDELMAKPDRYSLVLHEGKVQSIVPYRNLQSVNPTRLLTTIERTIPVQDYNRVLILPENIVHLEIVGTRQEAVAPGDLVQAGVMLGFSTMGTVAPFVRGFAVRLECTNGNTSNTIFDEFNFGAGGEGDDIWHWFRKSIRATYNGFNRILGGWRNMLNEGIPPADRAAMLEALLKRAHITGRSAEAIRARALETPPENSWDLYNLLTWGTSHVIEQPLQIAQAQETAADFASEAGHRKVCPLCHHTN